MHSNVLSYFACKAVRNKKVKKGTKLHKRCAPRPIVSLYRCIFNCRGIGGSPKIVGNNAFRGIGTHFYSENVRRFVSCLSNVFYGSLAPALCGGALDEWKTIYVQRMLSIFICYKGQIGIRGVKKFVPIK